MALAVLPVALPMQVPVRPTVEPELARPEQSLQAPADSVVRLAAPVASARAERGRMGRNS